MAQSVAKRPEARDDRRSLLEATIIVHDLERYSTYVLHDNSQLVTVAQTSSGSGQWLGDGSWRASRQYLGADCFYPGYKETILKELLQAKDLRKAVKDLAKKEFDAADWLNRPSEAFFEKQAWEQLRQQMDGLIADMSSFRSLRFMAFVINTAFSRMYHQGLHVREAEVRELRRWAQRGQEEKLSMIFLPCHKSHIDYLSISYIFYRLGISLPHIAAGDNLNIPMVGPLLKKCGAFFIRRGKWGETPMYSVLVREYLDLLLRNGHNIEAFIEGTRSRTGKLLPPKFGILKMVLESVLFGRSKDCIIVPMSIGYDNVLETNTYASELLGAEKEPESLAGVAKASRVLGLRLGRVDIRFAKPYLLTDFIRREIQSERRPNFNPVKSAEHRNVLLQSFGYQVLGQINAVSVVMPTALVGTVLLTLRGNGVGREELIRRVEWLRKEIVAKGGSVADFGGLSTGQIVDRALAVIKDYVGERKGLLEKVYYAIKPFELSLYRNQVINLFISESILTIAMYTAIKNSGARSSRPRIRIRPDLMDDVSFLSQLFKNEFIYASGRIENIVKDTLRYLEEKDVVVVERVGVPEDWVGTVALSPDEVKNGRETYDLLCFLLWPYVEAYWLTVVGIFCLVTPEGGESVWCDEATLLARLQQFGQTLFFQGDLVSMEAYNKETLKNALNRLQEMGVIVARKAFEARPPTRPSSPQNVVKPPETPSAGAVYTFLSLHPDHIPPSGFLEQPRGRLWELVARIGQFRREGKQRRDNMTVSNRVLRLAMRAAEWKAPKLTLLERPKASREEHREVLVDGELDEVEESEAAEGVMMGSLHPRSKI